MKKWIEIILLLTFVVCLPGCKSAQGQLSAESWQEQYDLGVRYLSEGNYQEAVLTFTAAIEIDPKQTHAYIGRGDSYVLAAQALLDGITKPDQLGPDAITAYQNALEDYLKAIELGETDAELYRKAAEVYIALGDPYTAAELLGEDGPFLESAIAVGYNSVVEVKADGSLWAYGSAVYGLMDYFGPSLAIPTQIMTDAASVFAWNARTDGHSAVPEVYTAVLKRDGTLWLLGDKPGSLWNVGNSSTPIQVADQATSVCAGEGTLAILKTDGSLWVQGWEGDNKVMDDVVSVSSCGASFAAIKTDGSLWMWGSNTYGQLGTGNTDSQDVPVKVMDSVASVSMCHTHTAAVKTDGSLWMWGNNSYGQLGNAMEYNDTAILSGRSYDTGDPVTVQFSVQTIPVEVMDHVALVSVNGGSGHSTHAVRTDSSLWCWGNNTDGQLGNGGSYSKEVSVPHVHNDGSASYSTYTIQDVPVKVMDDVMAVSGNFGTTAVVKRDGTVWMTGRSVTSWEEYFETFTEIPDLNYNSADVSSNLFGAYAGD